MDVSFSAWRHAREESLELKGDSFSFLFDRRYTNRLNRMSRVFFEAYVKATKELATKELELHPDESAAEATTNQVEEVPFAEIRSEGLKVNEYPTMFLSLSLLNPSRRREVSLPLPLRLQSRKKHCDYTDIHARARAMGER